MCASAKYAYPVSDAFYFICNRRLLLEKVVIIGPWDPPALSSPFSSSVSQFSFILRALLRGTGIFSISDCLSFSLSTSLQSVSPFNHAHIRINFEGLLFSVCLDHMMVLTGFGNMQVSSWVLASDRLSILLLSSSTLKSRLKQYSPLHDHRF